MKLFCLVLILISAQYLNAQTTSNKLKLNSFQFDIQLGINQYFNKNTSNIKNYYKNINDYESNLGIDSTKWSNINGSSGGNGTVFKVGFTPYSNKKNAYSEQELVFGVGFSYYGSNYLYKSYETSTSIDSVNYYSISSTTGDTLGIKTGSLDSINTTNEYYRYHSKKIMIIGEWVFKPLIQNKFSIKLGVGSRFSFLYNAKINYSFSNRYAIDFNETYSYYHSNAERITLINYSKIYKGNNGVAIEPYFKLNLAYKFNKKENLLSHFSIETNGFIGGSFYKIFKVETINSELLYGASLGLKYTL